MIIPSLYFGYLIKVSLSYLWYNLVYNVKSDALMVKRDNAY